MVVKVTMDSIEGEKRIVVIPINSLLYINAIESPVGEPDAISARIRMVDGETLKYTCDSLDISYHGPDNEGNS